MVGLDTDWKLGIAILIGYVILVANRVFNLNPNTPALNWRAAHWLPVYLVGMGLIVYLSDFGPLDNPWFPLWWDMFAVAVFSLVIYAWAQRVALHARGDPAADRRGAAGVRRARGRHRAARHGALPAAWRPLPARRPVAVGRVGRPRTQVGSRASRPAPGR